MARYIKPIIGMSIAAGLLLGCNGCALLTAQTVGTFVAGEVGHAAIEKVKDDNKSKDAEKTPEKQEQPAQPDDSNRPLAQLQ